MIFYDIKLIDNKHELDDKSKIVLYGVGGRGQEIRSLLNCAKIDIWYFCDRDKAKCGIWDGKCVPPEHLATLITGNAEKVYLIACIERPEEAWKAFSEMNFGDNVRFITYWGIKFFCHQNRDYLFGDNRFVSERLELEDKISSDQYKAWRLLLLEWLKYDYDAIWDVQPGKTGSTLVKDMLTAKGVSVHHFHNIVFPGWGVEELREEWESAISNRTKKPLKLIVFVRNPLDRDYSAFWDAFKEDYYAADLQGESDSMQKKYDKYVYRMIADEGSDGENCKSGMGFDEFSWFDYEIKKGLGVDVYRYPFDPDKGFEIIREGNIEFFVGKLEALSSFLEELGKFVGTELEMNTANSASKKWYSMAYKEFRREVKISKEYVDYYFKDNNRVDHFYSKEEQQGFLNKWKDNLV